VTTRTWLRIALGYQVLVAVQLGVWALLAPRSFYDGFPGLGRSWVSVDGPFNEHLVRDVGALNLALAAILIAAFVRMSGELVAVAGIASILWGLPHLIYHVLNRDGLDTSDLVVSIAGLSLAVIVSVGLIVFARSGRLERA
jgi:hypothetical protein